MMTTDARLATVELPAKAGADYSGASSRPDLFGRLEVSVSRSGLSQSCQAFAAESFQFTRRGRLAKLTQGRGAVGHSESLPMSHEGRSNRRVFLALRQGWPRSVEVRPRGLTCRFGVARSIQTASGGSPLLGGPARHSLAQPLGVGSSNGLALGSLPPGSHSLNAAKPELTARFTVLGRSVVAVRPQVFLSDARAIEGVASAVGESHVADFVPSTITRRNGPTVGRGCPRAAMTDRLEVAPAFGANALRHRAFERGDRAGQSRSKEDPTVLPVFACQVEAPEGRGQVVHTHSIADRS